MSNEQQAAEQQPQYVTAERYQKLVAYVNQLASNFNELATKVEQLENWEKTRQRIEDEQVQRAQRRAARTKFEGRDAALEAEAGS
jgi:outer membrane murein-binding lipoprotein Lpp